MTRSATKPPAPTEADVLRSILATPGVKSLKTKLPRFEAPPKGGRLADGTAFVSFEVPDRPSPWRVPTTSRSGVSRKGAALLKWQATVRHHARLAMGDLPPYAWPVRVEFTFRVSAAPNGAFADLSNLVKGTEDALQGVVFTNDRIVCRIESERVMDQADGATVRVYAFDPIGREP